jgi:hypothetical protein
MSAAVKAVRAILGAHAPLTAVVPATRMTAGEIPQDTAWPVILLLHQATSREAEIAYQAGEEKLATLVTVIPLAEGYAQMSSITDLIVNACNGARGTFDGVSVYSCLRESIGNDEFFDERGLWSRPLVLRVLYVRP